MQLSQLVSPLRKLILNPFQKIALITQYLSDTSINTNKIYANLIYANSLEKKTSSRSLISAIWMQIRQWGQQQYLICQIVTWLLE